MAVARLASNSGSLVARSPSLSYRWPAWLELLRWHKPTGRLILLLASSLEPGCRAHGLMEIW